MISRLRKITKKIAATVITGVVILTSLPVVQVKAENIVNYHLYQNAKQVYDAVENVTKIYTTPDNAELFWVTKSNKATDNSHLKYRTLGWRLTLSGGGQSETCDLILGTTITKPFGQTEDNGYYYILYAIDMKTVYQRMMSRNSVAAAAIYSGKTYNVKAYPIMTVVPANSSPSGSLNSEDETNGTVSTTGFICYMDTELGYGSLKDYANWSTASYTAFSDFHTGRECDIKTLAYNINYKIVDSSGNPAANISLSDGLCTNDKGGVVYSSGGVYFQTVRSFAPVNSLKATANVPGYTLSGYWKNDTFASEMGTEITSYAIGGNITLTAQLYPITYTVEYYKDDILISSQIWGYDSEHAIEDGSDITWNGGVFKNWNTKKDGSGTTYYPGQTVSKMTTDPSQVIRLYAQSTPKEYEITLNKAGGNGGTDKIYEKYGVKYTSESENTISSPAEINTLTSPVKYGYDFNGYYASANGYGNKLADSGVPMLIPARNQTVKITGSKEMFDDYNSHVAYADYKPRTPVVSFDKQGGINGTDSVKAVYGKDLPVKADNGYALQAPSKEGWSFKGYYSEPDGKGTQFYSESMGPVKMCNFENPVTVYAYWVDNIAPNVTIVPDVSGWSNSPVTITVRMHDKGSGLNVAEFSIYADGSEIPVTNFQIAGDSSIYTDKASQMKNGETRDIIATFTCDTEGIHTYRAVVTDMTGNSSSAQAIAYYDVTPPRGHVNVSGPGVTDNVSLKTLNNESVWTFKNGKVTDCKTD